MSMTSRILVGVMVALLWIGGAAAEYREIQATEIVTIATADRDAAPRILVKWVLPEELATKIIDGAAISMTLTRSSDVVLGVDVYPLSRNWTAVTSSWQTGWSRAGGDFSDSLPSHAIATERNGGHVKLNVYDIVQDQIAGRRPNFGFIVIPSTGEQVRLSRVEANDAAKLSDAKLVIAYRDRR